MRRRQRWLAAPDRRGEGRSRSALRRWVAWGHLRRMAAAAGEGAAGIHGRGQRQRRTRKTGWWGKAGSRCPRGHGQQKMMRRIDPLHCRPRGWGSRERAAAWRRRAVGRARARAQRHRCPQCRRRKRTRRRRRRGGARAAGRRRRLRRRRCLAWWWWGWV